MVVRREEKFVDAGLIFCLVEGVDATRRSVRIAEV